MCLNDDMKTLVLVESIWMMTWRLVLVESVWMVTWLWLSIWIMTWSLWFLLKVFEWWHENSCPYWKYLNSDTTGSCWKYLNSNTTLILVESIWMVTRLWFLLKVFEWWHEDSGTCWKYLNDDMKSLPLFEIIWMMTWSLWSLLKVFEWWHEDSGPCWKYLNDDMKTGSCWKYLNNDMKSLLHHWSIDWKFYLKLVPFPVQITIFFYFKLISTAKFNMYCR